MSRNPIARLIVLSLALVLAACAAYQTQHRAAAPAAESHPAAPAAVRPTGEFTELTPDGQIARIRGEAEEAKTLLSQQGHYSCCVHPPCTQCLLKFGECHCRDTVRKGGAACGDCTEAWIKGRGTVEGVSAKEIVERSQKALAGMIPKEGGEEKPPQEQHRH